MFPDLITPASDFEHQLGACVNAMSQDDAIGQILVFERMSGTLQMRHIASADLVAPTWTTTKWSSSTVATQAATRGSTCSFRVSASTTSCTKPDPSSPFRGAFSCMQHRNAGVVRCRFLRARRPPRDHACPMFVGVAGTCPGSRDLRGCKRGKPCWSFLPTDLPRPSTPPTRVLSLAGGESLVFPQGVSPWTVPSSNP